MSATMVEIPDGFGLACPDPQRLLSMVATALDVPAGSITSVDDVQVEPVVYEIGTPMTHSLLRCRGSATDSDGQVRSWSAFVKVLQSPWEWEHIGRIPEEFRAAFADNVPWRIAEDGYRPDFVAVLPTGMRQPRLYDVVELDDRHVAMWTEDVEVSREPWDAGRFEHAAELLGRLAGRRPIGCSAVLVPSPQAAIAGWGLRFYVGGRVRMGVLPVLADDAAWLHPTVVAAIEAAAEPHLRADLLAAAAYLDKWLDLLDALPQTYCHGDASPQNLLVPVGEPDTFAVIDWSFNSPQAVGFDLGQLLVGLAHAGELDVDDLPALVPIITAAFHRGLTAEGFEASAEQVRTGFLVSLIVRSALTALPFETLGTSAGDAQSTFWIERIRLTRLMLDLAREFETGAPGPLA